MKKEEKTRWIFFSIYYPEQEWYMLLQKGIIPFLRESHSRYFINYILHFGNNRGEYVGLSFEITLGKDEIFVKQFNDFFSEFLNSHPGKKKSQVNSVHKTHSTFIDFPLNSIYHSLHHFPFLNRRTEYVYVHAWCLSSHSLLDVFGNDIFNNEDLFTATIYLNLLLLISFKESAALYLQRSTPYDKNDPDSITYAEKFVELKALLAAVLEDCMAIANEDIKDDLKHIAKWFHIFKALLQQESGDIETQSGLLESIIIQTREQLSIVSESKSMIDFFIKQLLYNQYEPLLYNN